MNLNIDLSQFTSGDLTTLAFVLALLLILFVILLYTQRKYLGFLRRPPQYKIDAQRHEQRVAEIHRNNVDALEALKYIDEPAAQAKGATPGPFDIPGAQETQEKDEHSQETGC